ncbi:MAG: glycosyl hydrolase family 2 [Bacteroidaceae bacterium]|nr:glycosyl hydrolase family 2 [Bacteroidaceae bacterium]
MNSRLSFFPKAFRRGEVWSVFFLLTFSFCFVFQSFAQVPTWPKSSIQTRPGARWWWMGSAVDEKNLSYLMEEYAKTGIGTLEITPIYGVQKATDNITYLSTAWMNKLKTVEALGTANDLQIDMNMGSGWPYGGPWVPLEEAAGKLVYTHADFTTTAAAPTITYDVTPAANSTLNCVMAYPQRMKGVDTLDVTGFVKKNTLTWTPEQQGKWRIVALFDGHTMQQVKRAAPGGEGYVLDHLDSAAVAHYIQHFEKVFDKNGNPYPATFFNDSYEIFGADWSPRFLEEFEKRRGYKLQWHLQELFQLSSDPQTQVRADYRETMADMYLDNFVKPWTDFAHRHGVKTRNQSHGSPSNLIDTYASVDIPEIEGYGMTPLNIKGLRKDEGFTVKNSSNFSTLKMASSAAHLTGKQLTSSETFTWFTEHFRTSLSQMKPEMDLMFLAGVNRMFFHGTTYSPREASWPGHKFYASIDMSPTNSIWTDAAEFMQYVNRCQSFLQWGEPDNDILVYFTCYNSWHVASTNWLRLCAISDFSSQYSKLNRAVDSLDVYGYGCDYITDKMIENLRYENGEFVTEGGAHYKALQIPVELYMPQATRARLDSLAALGAKIVSQKRDESIFNDICPPEPMRRQLGLRYIRRSNPTGHHYFISNLTANDVADYVALAVDFQSAAIFNPLDGSIRQALVNEDGKVYLNLHSGESLVLQTYNYDIATAQLEKDHDVSEAQTTDIPLDASWTLTFNDAKLADGSSYTKTYTLDSPQTWETLDDQTAQLMGTGFYETTVHLTADQLNGKHFEMHLGDVRESARLYINNVYVGCAWSVPFVLDCTDALKAGNNTVRIEVTNLPANRIRRMDQDGTQWRIFEDINISTISASNNVGTTNDSFAGWSLVPSGLNAPVTLRAIGYPDDATGIAEISAADLPAPTTTDWYTLQGVRVERPAMPGIYINGGRKVVVK